LPSQLFLPITPSPAPFNNLHEIEIGLLICLEFVPGRITLLLFFVVCVAFHTDVVILVADETLIDRLCRRLCHADRTGHRWHHGERFGRDMLRTGLVVVVTLAVVAGRRGASTRVVRLAREDQRVGFLDSLLTVRQLLEKLIMLPLIHMTRLRRRVSPGPLTVLAKLGRHSMQLLAVKLIIHTHFLLLNLPANTLRVFGKSLHFRTLTRFYFLAHDHSLDFIEHVSSLGNIMRFETWLVLLVGQFLFVLLEGFLFGATFTQPNARFCVVLDGQIALDWRHVWQ